MPVSSANRNASATCFCMGLVQAATNSLTSSSVITLSLGLPSGGRLTFRNGLASSQPHSTVAVSRILPNRFISRRTVPVDTDLSRSSRHLAKASDVVPARSRFGSWRLNAAILVRSHRSPFLCVLTVSKYRCSASWSVLRGVWVAVNSILAAQAWASVLLVNIADLRIPLRAISARHFFPTFLNVAMRKYLRNLSKDGEPWRVY